MKQFAKAFTFIAVLICLFMPIIYWSRNTGLNQWQVFARTWLFLVYGFVIYVIGTATVKQLFDE